MVLDQGWVEEDQASEVEAVEAAMAREVTEEVTQRLLGQQENEIHSRQLIETEWTDV